MALVGAATGVILGESNLVLMYARNDINSTPSRNMEITASDFLLYFMCTNYNTSNAYLWLLNIATLRVLFYR
jgi:hypothetical protein